MTFITAPYLGIVFTLCCMVLYSFAVRYSVKGKWTHALALLMIAGFLLRVYVALDPELHPWDERFHALVSKNLLRHPLKPTLYDTPIIPFDYRNWNSNHIWLHKQPLALWLIAGSLKVFGCQAWAVRVPSVILSTLGIKLISDIAHKLYNNRIAFITAFLFSIQGLLIEVAGGRTSTDHIDSIFLFFILLAVWCVVINRQKYLWSYTLLTGVCLGAAVLTKWLPALIVLPIWAILNAGKQHHKQLAIHFVVILLVAACVCVPWQVYIFRLYPLEAAFEYHYNALHLFTAVEGHKGNAWYHLNNLRIIYGECVYVAVLLFFYQTYKSRKSEDVAISCWFVIIFLFFSVVATKMPAYTLIAAPTILIMTAKSYSYLIEAGRKPFLNLVAILLIALPIRYSLERIKPLAQYVKVDMAQDSNWTAQTVIYSCPKAIELMFFTDCVAYEDAITDSINPSSMQVVQPW